ncbi:hypothetical protein [Streptomyces syringium]|uniref:hypothetical protein n=1 Tax=Streptomyces syringium TaxID=76729 RepID=UPI0033CCFD62
MPFTWAHHTLSTRNTPALDWHRKYHCLSHHIEAGHDPATLRRDTVIDGVEAGSWLHRQLTTWTQLDPGQRTFLTHLGLNPNQVPLPTRNEPGTPASSRRHRSFAQTVALLRAFVERHGRLPSAREWLEVDGERVMIGPWLCKMRTRYRAGQLPLAQGKLMHEILREEWPGTPPTP